MALVPKITSGGKDYTLFEQPTSGLSTSVYRYDDPAVAPVYRPTVTFRAVQNSAKTNHTMYLDVKLPVVETSNGVTQAPNKVQLKVSFTSLQNVVTPLTGDAVDLAIAALTALKANLVSGKVN